MAKFIDTDTIIEALSKAINPSDSKPVVRMQRSAIRLFAKFLAASPFPELNLRVKTDSWRERLSETDLGKMTRTKYYNAITKLLSRAVANGLIPTEEFVVTRKLPRFAKPAGRPELEEWLAYERFAKWFDNQGDTYGPLCSNHFTLFKVSLLLKNDNTAQRNYSRLSRFWSRKVKAIMPLPFNVPPFSRKQKLRYGLDVEFWPERLHLDFELYESKRSQSDLYTLESGGRLVKPTTLKQYQERIGRYLGFLKITHPVLLHSDPDLVSLLTPDLLEMYVDWHIVNCSNGSERAFHSDFLWMCADIVDSLTGDASTVEALRNKGKRIVPIKATAFDKKTFVDMDKIALAAEQALGAATDMYQRWKNNPDELNAVEVADTYCQALIFALFTWRPFRSRNIRELLLGRNLRREEDTWKFRFSSTETKTGSTIALNWPEPLVEHLEIYLGDLRSILNVHGSPELFITRRSKPYTQHSLWKMIASVGQKYLQAPSHPHAFRRWIVTGFLLENPGEIETCKALLGHRFVKITLKYYAFVFTRAASRHSGRIIPENCPHARKVASWRPAA